MLVKTYSAAVNGLDASFTPKSLRAQAGWKSVCPSFSGL